MVSRQVNAASSLGAVPATEVAYRASDDGERLAPRVAVAISPTAIVIGVVLLFAGLSIALDGLGFPARKDEVHFWPTSLRFSQHVVPPVDLLRTYEELNTPLPFVFYGQLERLLHGGLRLARFANLTLGAGILALIALTAARRPTAANAAAVVGVLACPYFLFVGVHAYTDIIATLLALIGVAAHSRGAYVGAGVAFILAIASRQYMVAFPAALVAFEVLSNPAPRERPGRWIWPCIAILSLGGWYLFFGGFGPVGETVRQKIVTVRPTILLPRNALYFFACLGVYYVLPELVLFRGSPLTRLRPTPPVLGIAVALLLCFMAFPPMQNENFPVKTMGSLDVAARHLGSDVLRLGLFYVLALAAALRFRRPTLGSLFVLVNAVLMMKAHIAWDKYAVPLLVVLWYLQAGGGPPRLSLPPALAWPRAGLAGVRDPRATKAL